MVATYGTTVAWQPPAHERRRPQSAVRVLVLCMGVAIVGMVATSLMQPSAPRRVALEEIPAAVQDLQNFVDVAAAKSWVNDTFTNAQSHQALHPMSDLDPFTHQPVAPGDYQSMLRAHKTKAVTDEVHAIVTAEIADAQQSARDWAGTDAGCSHEKLDQTDYNGPVALAVTGQACLPWADALTLGYNAYDPLVYPELVANECRNPNADRIGSWCYLDGITAGLPDAEGSTWEYCDIGKRCKVDMPLLHAKHTSTLKPASNPSATLKPAHGQVLARRTQVPSGLLRYKQARKEGRAPHVSSKFHQQQLAAVPVQAVQKHEQSRDMYSWDDGISSKQARQQLSDNGWFMMDRSAPRGVDTGIEQGISGESARRSVDRIWK